MEWLTLGFACNSDIGYKLAFAQRLLKLKKTLGL